MRTVSVELFKYHELTAEAQSKARDWWREGGLDYDWWDSVYNDATTCLSFAGFTIEKIYFSGFASQGDGASFDATWRAADVRSGELRQHAPKDKALHDIAKRMRTMARRFPRASFTVRQSGHYMHSGCTTFDVALHDDPARADAIAPEIAEAAENELTSTARAAMDWIYRQLEADHDYLMSDENVAEVIQINEYEFRADGRRHVASLVKNPLAFPAKLG